MGLRRRRGYNPISAERRVYLERFEELTQPITIDTSGIHSNFYRSELEVDYNGAWDRQWRCHVTFQDLHKPVYGPGHDNTKTTEETLKHLDKCRQAAKANKGLLGERYADVVADLNRATRRIRSFERFEKSEQLKVL